MLSNRKGLTLAWSHEAWLEYVSYLSIDKKFIKKVNRLIKSIQRDGHRVGLGKPEPLRYAQIPRAEGWSRRIDKQYRLAYYVMPPYFKIVSCKYHY